MKTKVLSLVALFMFGALAVFAGNKTEKIKVLGACGMCETRIEKTAKAIEGVSKADWSKETEILEVKFDDTKTSVDKIEKALAVVGHDTEKYKASDDVYNKLPACCHYDRTEIKTK
jgi:mercuric ion binding protein